LMTASIVDAMYPCLSTNANSAHGLEQENPTEFNKMVFNFINRP